MHDLLFTTNCVVFVYALLQIDHTMADEMMRAVQFEPGGPEKLFVGRVPVPTPRERQVLLRIHTTAINRADMLQRRGLYPPPPGESEILGLEAAGVIQSLGHSCSGKWKVGDKVMALLGGGGNSEYVACREELLMPVPSGMNWVQAAAIPEVWLTAYQLLHTIGQIQAGEVVLIHGGASGVGTAAIQLASLAGATSIVTAGSDAKLQATKSLGATAGFNYKEGDFSQKVLATTGGEGVNLILDCVGGAYYEQNMNCIAVDGRWVVFGLMGGGTISGDVFNKLLRKRVTITGTTLRTRKIEYKEELIRNFSRDILPHFDTGRVKPQVFATFALENIGEAHAMMEGNRNTGKIVIEVIRGGRDEL